MCSTSAVVDFIEKHEASFEKFIINVEFKDSSYFPEFVIEVVDADDDIMPMAKREAGNEFQNKWFSQGDVISIFLTYFQINVLK